MAFQGIADTELRLGIDTDFLRQSVDRAQQVFDRFNRRSVRSMGRIADRQGAQSSVFGQLMYPSNQSKSPQAKMAKMNQQVRRQTMSLDRLAKQSMKQMTKQADQLAKASPFAQWERDLKKFQKEASRARGADKAIFGGAGVFEREEAQRGRFGKFASRAGGALDRGARALPGMARRGAMGVGRGAIKAGMFGGGALMGFLVSAFREAIGNFEKQQRGRLTASATLGPNARFARGTSMGYNSAEAAQIQAQGARAGIGGPRGGQYSMQLMRAIGSEGLQFGGAMMSRQNLRGAAGGKQMMKQMSTAFSVAIETGLERARVPEFLQGLNELAEQQIRITPDKDMYKSFTRELGVLAMGGLRGRYGTAALKQMHGAIQGATGVRQAFTMRAFDFGRGASLIDVLKQQEKGATGGNIIKVLEQIRRETGAGEGGGFSTAGKLEFKGLGYGSISMAEKLSDIYFKGGGSRAEKQKRIQEIMQKEQKKQADAKLKNMPRIQVQAYQNMAKFGGVVARLSSRFDRMAALGIKWFPMLKKIDQIQLMSVKHVIPIMGQIGKLLPTIGKGMNALMGPISKGITGLLSAMNKLIGGAQAFSKGFSGYKGRMGVLGALGAGMSAFGGSYGNNLGPKAYVSMKGGMSRGQAQGLIQEHGFQKAREMVRKGFGEMSVNEKVRANIAQETAKKDRAFTQEAVEKMMTQVQIQIQNKTGSKVSVRKKQNRAQRNGNRRAVTVR